MGTTYTIRCIHLLALMVACILASCGGGVTTTDSRAQTVTGTATLAWQPSLTYTDNSPLVPAGYRIYYGTSSRTYTTILDIPVTNFSNPDAPRYSVNDLPEGTYYFAVSVYDASHTEGALSNEAVKTIL